MKAEFIFVGCAKRPELLGLPSDHRSLPSLLVPAPNLQGLEIHPLLSQMAANRDGLLRDNVEMAAGMPKFLPRCIARSQGILIFVLMASHSKTGRKYASHALGLGNASKSDEVRVGILPLQAPSNGVGINILGGHGSSTSIVNLCTCMFLNIG
ncbi:hypothetical protein SODALDRAFT_354535 [Sodiomyces alkalinus F11]|uniref:Uncharacterized protein n=1 Tax=Sodiomyces alkalinus (strain CBS 110278 / VKM F-3762 / F11) TaxID=1314773 RepID=A0A3N2Q6M0_SODAK|nr:hypothetical protein SODALDRAFT_354535 [Sodiomyces alkalinus F11]ROT42392.1 hypothetical protein SODALDRAFT_354535 [Sodiomyces alkalinus F11]